MNRRKLLGAAAGATALAALPAAALADHHETHGHGHALNGKLKKDVEMMQQHITLLNRVASHCLEQIKEKQGDVADHAANHEVAMDCVPVCQTTCSFMVRDSPLSAHLHEATAKCCDTTAQILSDSKDDAAVVKECVESCRMCAKMCRSHV